MTHEDARWIVIFLAWIAGNITSISYDVRRLRKNGEGRI